MLRAGKVREGMGRYCNQHHDFLTLYACLMQTREHAFNGTSSTLIARDCWSIAGYSDADARREVEERSF